MLPKVISFLFVFSLFLVDNCNAQLEEWQNMIRNGEAARRSTQARENYARQMERVRKQYTAQYRNQRKIYEESDGLFGAKRTWKAGVYTAEGALASIKKGKVTLITQYGPLTERLSKLSDEDKEHIKLFRSWEKLGTERRKEWIAEYHRKIEEEKKAAAEAAEKAKEERRQLENALRDAKRNLELTDFKLLKEAYGKITPNETTQDEAVSLLGGKSEVVSAWRKTVHGESGTLRWISRHPDTNELVTLRIVFKNGFVSSVETIGLR